MRGEAFIHFTPASSLTSPLAPAQLNTGLAPEKVRTGCPKVGVAGLVSHPSRQPAQPLYVNNNYVNLPVQMSDEGGADHKPPKVEGGVINLVVKDQSGTEVGDGVCNLDS
jgi:hypothetical protein